MPVRWDPLAVAQAMDEVEGLLAQARPFLEQARQKCDQAARLPRLSQHMRGRLTGLGWEVERFMKNTANDIVLVRKDLPQRQLEQLEAQHRFL